MATTVQCTFKKCLPVSCIIFVSYNSRRSPWQTAPLPCGRQAGSCALSQNRYTFLSVRCPPAPLPPRPRPGPALYGGVRGGSRRVRRARTGMPHRCARAQACSAPHTCIRTRARARRRGRVRRTAGGGLRHSTARAQARTLAQARVRGCAGALANLRACAHARARGCVQNAEAAGQYAFKRAGPAPQRSGCVYARHVFFAECRFLFDLTRFPWQSKADPVVSCQMAPHTCDFYTTCCAGWITSVLVTSNFFSGEDLPRACSGVLMCCTGMALCQEQQSLQGNINLCQKALIATHCVCPRVIDPNCVSSDALRTK